MKRKPKKRAASKPAKKTKKGAVKARKSAVKSKPARAQKSAAKPRAKAAKSTKTKAPSAKRPSAAHSNGAATARVPKAHHEEVLEHAHLEHDDEGITIGGYDETEDLEEGYVEEEEEHSNDSEEDY